MSSCPICLENYTAKARPAVKCQYCPAEACRGCQQAALLNTYEDPHCFSCKQGWSSEFMATNFSVLFRNQTLRRHRRKILFEREKALLPTMQIFVEAKKKMAETYVTVENARNSLTLASGRYSGIGNELRDTDARYYILRRKQDGGGQLSLEEQTEFSNIRTARNEVKTKSRKYYTDVYQPAYTTYMSAQREYERWQRLYATGEEGADGEEARQRREFLMRCPADGCRGFLSTAYKCGTCSKQTCSECLEMLPDAVEHKCKPESVESAKAIKKETRPCPKCGARIFKIDGCFAKDTPVLLWNGTVKMSQDICVGDELVGDDGQRRIVEELCSGEDNLYEVSQECGMSYIVNSKHTLVLSNNADVVEIIVDDYMKLSDEVKSNLYGYSVSSENHIKQTSIKVIQRGYGKYYGWNVGTNHRFLLADTTVVRNCDQMWCTVEGCNTAFSWTSGHVVTGRIHNPHYYEWLRRNGGGTAPQREAGDIPCGGIPVGWMFVRMILRCEPLTTGEKNHLIDIHRNVTDLEARLPQYPARPNALANKELNVAYLMNQISEAEWQRQLELSEAKFNRKKEIGQILQTLVTAAAEALQGVVARLEHIPATDRDALRLAAEWIRDTALPMLESLRIYTNDAYKTLAKSQHMAVPQIHDTWAWLPVRALYKKETVRKGTSAAVATGGTAEENEIVDVDLNCEDETLPLVGRTQAAS